jgi:NADH pyrophosphatase NudC (nudix superfamily)
LDERKAAIYENLRDLQFEFRVGKLSDRDYQNTKTDLQKELAAVLAETDRLKSQLGVKETRAAAAPAPGSAPVSAAPKNGTGYQCHSCGASFEKNLKFCGECGKPMQGVKA